MLRDERTEPAPYLEGVIGTLGFGVPLYIEGSHEVQDDTEPLLQADVVSAAGELGVGSWVFGAAELPRPRSEDLVRAQGWREEDRMVGLTPTCHLLCKQQGAAAGDRGLWAGHPGGTCVLTCHAVSPRAFDTAPLPTKG